MAGRRPQKKSLKSARQGTSKSKPKSKPQKKRSGAAQRPPVPMARVFTAPGEDPFRTTAFERRTARIEDAAGRTVFEQRGVEVPRQWSQLATDLVASRYFAGVPGRPGREDSVAGLVRRIVRTIGRWVRDGGALGTPAAAKAFEAELAHLLLRQRAAFNSPVWFNVGLDDPKPQCSACFIVGLDDRLDAILDLARIEGLIFSKGSGSGTNFSSLRGSSEPTRAGGLASGPVAFLRGLDALAGAIKSGGRTRRAAKMAVLDVDHPDVLEFIRSKEIEEERAHALAVAGLSTRGDVAQDAPVAFQNENHSVRVTDAFLEAAVADAEWTLVPRTQGCPPVVTKARALLHAMARAAHACGDPGLHFADTIEAGNPVPATGPIRASNPCSEFLFLDDTACNLASVNLMAFSDPVGEVDVAALRAAVRVLVLGMDAVVENAGYPTPRIARNSARLRPLGLGVANLGALVMSRGLAYDSEGARGLAAGLMALVGGEASLASATLAARLGPYAAWKANRASALQVLARHRDAARALSEVVPPAIRRAAIEAWDEAYAKAQHTGLRNAQVTCVAPTGTISFLMDCDTTGIEPELSLVSEKKLVGGGRLRLASKTLPSALARLGYVGTKAQAILAHVERTGSVDGAPGLDPSHRAVFDTALPPRPGGRALSPRAHLSMMAAVQPFVSGAISKTVNLPSGSGVEDVEGIFLAAWKLGLKAVAVYRDRSKVAQPLEPVRPAAADLESRRRPHPAVEAPAAQGGAHDRCRECGQGMVPDGACFVCPNCGATTGCG